MTEEEFREFVASAERVRSTQASRFMANTMIEYEEMRVGQYHWSMEHDLNDLDFNRDVVAPGNSVTLQEGSVRVMCDDDFFIVALLPFECNNLDVRTLIKILYPNTYEIIKDKEESFKPDSDDPWWDDHFAKQDAYFTTQIMKGGFDP